MEGVKPVGLEPQVPVISSEELKALLYLTLRGNVKLPENQNHGVSIETKKSEIDLKA